MSLEGTFPSPMPLSPSAAGSHGLILLPVTLLRVLTVSPTHPPCPLQLRPPLASFLLPARICVWPAIFTMCLVMVRLIYGVLGDRGTSPSSRELASPYAGTVAGQLSCSSYLLRSRPPHSPPLSTLGNTCVSSRLSWITCADATQTLRGAPGW